MVTVEFWGRMGNQLFQYAMCRSVAERNGYKFYINKDDWEGHGLFSCDLGTRDGSVHSVFKDSPGQKYNPKVFAVSDFTLFLGFYQTDKYFKRDDVKNWFTPNITESAKELIAIYNPLEYAFLNIRGTDYKKIPHFLLPLDYYERAMAYLLNINPNLKFAVVTDDIELSATYFPKLPIIHSHPHTDFCLLYSARYLVTAISTFAWWAGYLQDNNTVIAPSGWMNHNLNKEIFSPIDIKTDKFIWI